MYSPLYSWHEYRNIESAIKDLYEVDMSEAHISQHIEQWKSRKLNKVYMVVRMDAIVFKVRREGKVIDKAVQIAVGLNKQGYKKMLGMWLYQMKVPLSG